MNQLSSFMDRVINKNPEQVEFHQAVKEVMESIWEFLDENPHYRHANILERIVERVETNKKRGKIEETEGIKKIEETEEN